MITRLAFLTAISLAQGAAAPPAQDQTATYTNEWIGISITHPSNWKVVPKKSDAWITIPLKEGSAVGALNLLAISFNADTEIWQYSQKDTNVDMGNEVLRQWQEEILGVPLLLTKVRSGPGKLASAIKAVPELSADQPLVTLIGLVYSKTPRKMLFRLTAPESAFDDAEFLLRKTLESLRTADGKLPEPEDPTRKPDPITPDGKKPEGPPKKTTIGTGGKSEDSKPERAPKVFETSTAARKIGFYYPEGWTVEKSDDSSLTLKSADGTVVIPMTISSTLDSDPPLRALVKASAQTLKLFEKVESREENVPKANKAGATTVRIVRTGADANGPIWTFEAVGGSQQYYFLLTMKGTGKLDLALRKTLETLLSQLSVEPLA